MLLALLFSFSLGGGASAFAIAPLGCTDWSKQSGVSCVFAGNDAASWRRDCSKAEDEMQCRRTGNEPQHIPCLADTICTNSNPNSLGEEPCTNWVKVPGVSCGGDKPVAWQRACAWEFVPEDACTNFRKKYPTEEDFVL
jgi:hypothetical protein